MTNTHDKPSKLQTLLTKITLAAIILNTGILAWDFFGDENVIIEKIDIAILWYFVGELIIRANNKIRNDGWRKALTDGWLIFDSIVIVLALLPLGENMTALRVMRISRFAHYGRHLPHLKHLTVLRWFGVLLKRGGS